MASHVTDIYSALARWYLKDRDGMLARLSRYLVREGECLIWIGGNHANGYGYLTMREPVPRGKSVKVYVHRLFMVLRLKRNIKEGHEVDHICCNRGCVVHLQEVPLEENKRLVHERRKKRG